MNILVSMDITTFVASLKPMQLMQVGTSDWLNQHDKLNKLNLQSVLEVVEKREEQVKEELLIHDKFKVLVHEAVCMNIWKLHIFPRLIAINPNPKLSFLLYTAFFHEAASVALLDTTLFNESACEALGDEAVDLVDYAVAKVRNLLATQQHTGAASVDTSVLKEIMRQSNDIDFKVGMRCISILYYLTTNSSKIPLSAIRRLIGNHDVAGLMSCLLEAKPWLRKLDQNKYEKFAEDMWRPVDPAELSKVNKYEAQTWHCLYQVVMTSSLMTTVEFNAWRQAYMSKIMANLVETLLDQLPHLLAFKEYLCRSAFSQTGGNDKQPLILETLPEMHQNLCAQISEKLIAQQETIFLSNDDSYIRAVAFRLNDVYNSEVLADLEDNLANLQLGNKPTKTTTEETTKAATENSCAVCKKPSSQRCGKCKKLYYCSRQCQKEHWTVHKSNCKL